VVYPRGVFIMASKDDVDALGIGGVGGFVDTTGSKRRKRKAKLGCLGPGGDNPAPDSPVARDVLKDEVEERLEEILFGKKPFNPVMAVLATSESDTDEEEEDEVLAKATLVSCTSSLGQGGVWYPHTQLSGHK
jgi:hypothetical protein